MVHDQLIVMINCYFAVENTFEGMCPEISIKSKRQEINISVQVVKQLRFLTSLNVSDCRITDKGADMMAASLLKTVSLERLDISNTTLDVAKTEKISNALKSVSSLKWFKINDNDIGDEAADSIAAVISNNSLLERVSLSHINLSSTGMHKIAVALSINKNIKKLDMSNNFITADSIKYLGATLSECPKLQELIMSQNLLDLTGVLQVARYFRYHCTLETLDLSCNAISFPSACEFIVDIMLSVNQKLDNLNVCSRNIRPRYVDDYLSSPSSEKSPDQFSFQNLYLSQHSSLNTVGIQTKFIKVTEPCPISWEDVISYYVDHVGGAFYNQYHDFAIVIPPGAVSQGECVEIQATASHFGPYKIPNRLHPISSFFWISANYTFKIPVYVIINHYAKIRNLEDIDHLYVLQTCACDSTVAGGKLVMNIVSEGVYFDYEIGYCVLATDHFCSFSTASDASVPQYLLASYCAYDKIAEVCFCPSNCECKKVNQM